MTLDLFCVQFQKDSREIRQEKAVQRVCYQEYDCCGQLCSVLLGTLEMPGVYTESVPGPFPYACTRAGKALADCKSQGPERWVGSDII